MHNWEIKALKLTRPKPWEVDKYKEQQQARYVPSENDFWKVYNVANQEQKAVLLTCLHLAARKAEVFSLMWDDVDFQGEKVR